MTTLREFIRECETQDQVVDISEDCKDAVLFSKDTGIKVIHSNK